VPIHIASSLELEAGCQIQTKGGSMQKRRNQGIESVQGLVTSTRIGWGDYNGNIEGIKSRSNRDQKGVGGGTRELYKSVHKKKLHKYEAQSDSNGKSTKPRAGQCRGGKNEKKRGTPFPVNHAPHACTTLGITWGDCIRGSPCLAMKSALTQLVVRKS
jgi:hypothetical protein